MRPIKFASIPTIEIVGRVYKTISTLPADFLLLSRMEKEVCPFVATLSIFAAP